MVGSRIARGYGLCAAAVGPKNRNTRDFVVGKTRTSGGGKRSP
jgi:hypothetical protein